jgi:hypothetical protein
MPIIYQKQQASGKPGLSLTYFIPLSADYPGGDDFFVTQHRDRAADPEA